MNFSLKCITSSRLKERERQIKASSDLIFQNLFEFDLLYIYFKFIFNYLR